jgi:hypothetical protein
MVYQKQFIENTPSTVVFWGFESGSTFVHARAYRVNELELNNIRIVSAVDCPDGICPALTGTNVVNINLGQSDAILRFFVGGFSPAPLVALAKQLVGLEIADKPDSVGKPIDILRITKDGGCWVEHEKECGKDIPFCKQTPQPTTPKRKPIRRRPRHP